MDALNNGLDLKGTAVSFENQCAGCHQTGMAVQVDTATYGGTPVQEVVTGYVELNIGCEACHGPGAAHAASHDPADILNPGRFTGVEGIRRANEVCGSCHSRGASITLPGMSLPMQAPALLSGSAAIPFLPGNNLLNDLGAAGAFVTLTTTASNFWGSVNFAAADVNGKFPLYTASKSHHQQYMDIGQGPHAADKPFDVPCFGCHSPHSAANRHMIATTVKEGGVTKVTGTKEENDTLCLACHAASGDFSGITTADVQAVADGGSSAAVNTAILGHMIRRANMDVPIDLPNGVGRCTACHMPKTARSAAYTSSFLDADGKQQGDIRSHTMKVVMPNTSVRDVTSTFFNTSATDNSVSHEHARRLLGVPQDEHRGERVRGGLRALRLGPLRPRRLPRCGDRRLRRPAGPGTPQHGGALQLRLQRGVRLVPHRGRVRGVPRRTVADGPFHSADGEELPELRHVPRLRGPGGESSTCGRSSTSSSRAASPWRRVETRRSASNATPAANRRRASTRRFPRAGSTTSGTSTPISSPRPRSCTGRRRRVGTNTRESRISSMCPMPFPPAPAATWRRALRGTGTSGGTPWP